jgi:FlaG/FlaF family flagellin (archaellin)
MGTSAADTPSGTLITVTDGQATTINPVFTGYVDDNASYPIQFQLTDAIFTRFPTSVTLEEYGEQDLELSAIDVSVHYFERAELKTIGGCCTLEAYS